MSHSSFMLLCWMFLGFVSRDGLARASGFRSQSEPCSAVGDCKIKSPLTFQDDKIFVNGENETFCFRFTHCIQCATAFISVTNMGGPTSNQHSQREQKIDSKDVVLRDCEGAYNSSARFVYIGSNWLLDDAKSRPTDHSSFSRCLRNIGSNQIEILAIDAEDANSEVLTSLSHSTAFFQLAASARLAVVADNPKNIFTGLRILAHAFFVDRLHFMLYPHLVHHAHAFVNERKVGDAEKLPSTSQDQRKRIDANATAEEGGIFSKLREEPTCTATNTLILQASTRVTPGSPFERACLINAHYARLHNYCYLLVTKPMLDPAKFVTLHWEKAVAIDMALKQGFDLVLFIDDDAYVEKRDDTLNAWISDDHDIVIGEEEGSEKYLNTGVILLRNKPFVRSFVDDWLHSPACDENRRSTACCHDQTCFSNLARNNANFSLFSILPTNVWNCHPRVDNLYKGVCDPFARHFLGQWAKNFFFEQEVFAAHNEIINSSITKAK